MWRDWLNWKHKFTLPVCQWIEKVQQLKRSPENFSLLIIILLWKFQLTGAGARERRIEKLIKQLAWVCGCGKSSQKVCTRVVIIIIIWHFGQAKCKNNFAVLSEAVNLEARLLPPPPLFTVAWINVCQTTWAQTFHLEREVGGVLALAKLDGGGGSRSFAEPIVHSGLNDNQTYSMQRWYYFTLWLNRGFVPISVHAFAVRILLQV